MSATSNRPKRNDNRSSNSGKTASRRDPLLRERSQVKSEITRLECYIAGIEKHKKHSSRERIVTVPAPREYVMGSSYWSDESDAPATHGQVMMDRQQTRAVMSRFLWNAMLLAALVSLFWYGMTTIK